MALPAAGEGVKGLLEVGLGTLPEAFVFKQGRGDEDEDSGEFAELPRVDLSQSRDSVVKAIKSACQEWGSFQLLGHGIPLSLMQSVSNLAHLFFDLPVEDRKAFYSEDTKKPVRFGTSYTGATTETQQLWSDFLFHICNPLFKEQDVPTKVPNYWEIASEYVKLVDALAKHLLELLSEGLGMPPETLGEKMGDPFNTMRLNYYPPCPEPHLAVGIGKHTDSSAITILQQDMDVEGLQVLHKQKWMTVKPMVGAFVVNVGDQIEIMSNGKYKSLVHRAMVNQSRTRVSVASFYYPNRSTFVAPITRENEAPLYHGCKAEDYVKLYVSRFFTSTPAIQIMKAL